MRWTEEGELMRRLTAIALAALLPIALSACSSSADSPDPADAGTTVHDAAYAFVDGFNSGDATAIEGFLAPAGDEYGTADTLAAAKSALEAYPEGSKMSVDSFDISNTVGDQSNEEVVVTYEAGLEVTTPDDTTTVLNVTQDVAVQWIDGAWLITGADPADVSAGQPGL
jgi:hypothetical protein